MNSNKEAIKKVIKDSKNKIYDVDMGIIGQSIGVL